jgi:hypothetical protein
MDVQLITVNFFTLSSAGASVINRYNTNSAYEPQVGGSTAVTPGYSHWANFYGFYRVIGYSYEITFCNASAFPINCFVLNENNDPGTTAATQITANPLSQHAVVSSMGGMDKVVFKKRLTISQVAGTTAPETDDTYRALVNASPADVFWLGVGAQSVAGAVLTLGVQVAFYLTQYVRFYDRLQQ